MSRKPFRLVLLATILFVVPFFSVYYFLDKENTPLKQVMGTSIEVEEQPSEYMRGYLDGYHKATDDLSCPIKDR